MGPQRLEVSLPFELHHRGVASGDTTFDGRAASSERMEIRQLRPRGPATLYSRPVTSPPSAPPETQPAIPVEAVNAPLAKSSRGLRGALCGTTAAAAAYTVLATGILPEPLVLGLVVVLVAAVPAAPELAPRL